MSAGGSVAQLCSSGIFSPCKDPQESWKKKKKNEGSTGARILVDSRVAWKC